MKREVFVFACAALAAGCCVFSAPKDPRAARLEIIKTIQEETVALVRQETDDDENPAKTVITPFCAGVWVSHDTILTAEHCVASLGMPPERMLLEQIAPGMVKPAWNPVGQKVLYSTVVDVKGETGPRSFRGGTVVTIDIVRDLALVRADKDSVPAVHPFARISKDDIVEGAELHIMGHKTKLWWTYVPGVVAAIRPDITTPKDNVVKMLQVTAPVFMGDSGGGAFDQDGNLVGIASFIKLQVPNVAFFVHRDDIVTMLKAELFRDASVNK